MTVKYFRVVYKNEDVKPSAYDQGIRRASEIIFISYSQSQNIRKPNKFKNFESKITKGQRSPMSEGGEP